MAYLKKYMSVSTASERPRIYSGFYDFTEAELHRAVYSILRIQEVADGRRVIVLILPVAPDFTRYDGQPETPLASAIRPYAEEHQFELIDLLPAMHVDGQEWRQYFPSCDGHWNDLGHRRAAEIITSTGSGLQDRDEALPSVAGYRPFRQVADTLARHGIATLRLDDRGYGASGGNGRTATSRDFADDVRAGLEWLRHRPEIDPTRLAIVGHSEGGLIAPMVAATDTALRGIVLLAGPSRTGRDIVGFQQRSAIARAEGLSEAQRDSLIRVSQAATDSLARSSPWMAQFLEYDPLPTARMVRRTPVLIEQGAPDLQVTADQAPELEADGSIRSTWRRRCGRDRWCSTSSPPPSPRGAPSRRMSSPMPWMTSRRRARP
jgi:pimeloyl-ACP methyl ester carboxylesterase